MGAVHQLEGIMRKNIELFGKWNVSELQEGTKFTFPSPEGAGGFFSQGFCRRSDSAFDAMDYAGLELTVITGESAGVAVTVEFAEGEPLTTVLPIIGKGVHTLFISWSQFPVETVNQALWQFLTAIAVTGAQVRRAVLRRAPGLCVECEVRGRAGERGGTVRYNVALYNGTDSTVAVNVTQIYTGWESMNAVIVPETIVLTQEAEADVSVTLTIPMEMVPGGHEATRLRFVPNGDCRKACELELQTLCRLPHPYIYWDTDGWREVAERIKREQRFHPAFEELQAASDAWEPEPPVSGADFCYFTDTENQVMSTAYCYAITGERIYAEKLAVFFRYFSDVKNGYPARLRGCHQSYVQEGHFFQHLAIPYDIIHDAGVLSEADDAAIERSFRIYMELLDKDIRNGRITNWVVSEAVGALYCALAIQDWAMAERFAFGSCGVFQQLVCGSFNDGWWHEGSIGYNTWVSSMMLHCAHALRPFGLDLIHAAFPVPFSREVSSSYAGRRAAPPFAMVNQKWGENRRPVIHIKDLFDAILPYLDWRGVMFGVNDSDEKTVEGVHFGSTYELAYRYYKDPAYLRVIHSIRKPDPVFSPDELPEREPEIPFESAFSDNVGIAMLRSQKPGREQREQIQAVLRYGSHGGAHGHFDITNLLSVMRYGRSLYNPECSWWGYRHFMYKWHVQCSLTKNMVNVDDKMQLPAESKRILWHTGRAFQAVGLETVCRWAYPPYGGMDYDDSPGDFEKRLEMNVAWFPVNEELPYGKITGETEPIYQRRVMAVTDDYIALFDYIAGEREHQYETTFQLKGLRELTAPRIAARGHKDRYTTDPASDGQMILDCSEYEMEGVSVARFFNRFGEPGIHGDPSYTESALQGDRSYHNEPGVLHADVYTAWPQKTTQIVGLMATYIGWPVSKDGYNIPLEWRIEADGRELASGAFDAWLLGRDEPCVELRGAKRLSLLVRQGDVTNERGETVRTPYGIFWGGAVLTLADGTEKRLSELPYTSMNINPGQGTGKDYEGGRVLLMGREYADAIPASTEKRDRWGTLEWDISKIDAVGFRAAIGCDPYPGDEDQRRRFYAVRAGRTKSARFTTVVEPYEKSRMVESVEASDASRLVVRLSDGRTQRLTLEETPLRLTLEEMRDGVIEHHETAL